MSEFEGAGQAEGLQIWRIEDFEVVPWTKVGTFHSGDSYIILKTTSVDDGFSHDIHFWLGSESSTDEIGTAAIKAVELDDLLGGSPVQYREVQGYESEKFESYFGKLKYLPGGVKSGFKDIDAEEVQKRLFLVKGKRECVKVEEVEFAFSSLNKSDCFVLDAGKGQEVMVFMPEKATAFERFKATQVANDIRDEDHAGDAKVEVIDAFSDQSSMFFEALGDGSSDALPEGSDVEAESNEFSDPILHKVVPSGTQEVSTGELSQSMLDPSDCFILDTKSSNGIFIWIGKSSSKEERVQALKSAEAFLEEQELPKWTGVKRIVENAETTMFKEYFQSWTDPEV